MEENKSAKNAAEIESVQRIEPARVEEVAEIITDVVAELSAAAAKLSHACIRARPPIWPASCAS